MTCQSFELKWDVAFLSEYFSQWRVNAFGNWTEIQLGLPKLPFLKMRIYKLFLMHLSELLSARLSHAQRDGVQQCWRNLILMWICTRCVERCEAHPFLWMRECWFRKLMVFKWQIMTCWCSCWFAKFCSFQDSSEPKKSEPKPLGYLYMPKWQSHGHEVEFIAFIWLFGLYSHLWDNGNTQVSVWLPDVVIVGSAVAMLFGTQDKTHSSSLPLPCTQIQGPHATPGSHTVAGAALPPQKTSCSWLRPMPCRGWAAAVCTPSLQHLGWLPVYRISNVLLMGVGKRGHPPTHLLA